MSIIAKSNPGLHKKYQELDAAFAVISTPKTMGSVTQKNEIQQNEKKRVSAVNQSCGITIIQHQKGNQKRISAPVEQKNEEDVPEFMKVLKSLKPSPRAKKESDDGEKSPVKPQTKPEETQK